MEPWVVPALTVGAGFVGGLFGSYFSKRGEIHAVHRELEKVVAQTTATTKAAEEIKAKISVDVWAKQRQWQLKKEVVFEAVKQLGTLHLSMLELRSVFRVLSTGPKTMEQFEMRQEASGRFNDALNRFWQVKILVNAVCGTSTLKTLEAIQVRLQELSEESVNNSSNVLVRVEQVFDLLTEVGGHLSRELTEGDERA